jgi:hypothetical protein
MNTPWIMFFNHAGEVVIGEVMKQPWYQFHQQELTTITSASLYYTTTEDVVFLPILNVVTE